MMEMRSAFGFRESTHQTQPVNSFPELVVIQGYLVDPGSWRRATSSEGWCEHLSATNGELIERLHPKWVKDAGTAVSEILRRFAIGLIRISLYWRKVSKRLTFVLRIHTLLFFSLVLHLSLYHAIAVTTATQGAQLLPVHRDMYNSIGLLFSFRPGCFCPILTHSLYVSSDGNSYTPACAPPLEQL